MLNPVQITAVEQIVNPTLWSRFVNTRKEMLLSKSDDLELLLKLGLGEEAVMKSAHVSLNFEKDAAIEAYPYNDNLALLFHCTRSSEAVDSILNQGLDERMGKTSGLLGRGIYFSDDAEKSIQYDGCGGIIFVFIVLLGDCLSVNHLPTKRNFVKEPEKTTNQKRNFNDFNFDSIYASTHQRLTTIRKNEYVIYNRYFILLHSIIALNLNLIHLKIDTSAVLCTKSNTKKVSLVTMEIKTNYIRNSEKIRLHSHGHLHLLVLNLLCPTN